MGKITDNLITSLIVIGVLFGTTFGIIFSIAHWINYLILYGDKYAYEVLPPLLWLEVAGIVILPALFISFIVLMIEIIIILIITK